MRAALKRTTPNAFEEKTLLGDKGYARLQQLRQRGYKSHIRQQTRGHDFGDTITEGFIKGSLGAVHLALPIDLPWQLRAAARGYQKHPTAAGALDVGLATGAMLPGGGFGGGKTAHAGGGFTERPMTREEAVARHTELEKQLGDLHKQIAKTTGHEYSDVGVARSEQARRNKINGILRKGDRALQEGKRPPKGYAWAKRHGEQQLVASDLHGHANEIVDKILAKHPNEPWAKAYKAAETERERLRAALEVSPEEQFGGGPAAPKDYGTIRVPRRGPVGPWPSQSPTAPTVPQGIPGLQRSPEELRGILQKSLGPLRRVAAENVKGYRPQRAERFAASSDFFSRAGGGEAGLAAARVPLKGELDKARFEGFQKHGITQQEMDSVINEVNAFHQARPEDLPWHDAQNLMGALRDAFREGKHLQKNQIKKAALVFGPDEAKVMARKGFWMQLARVSTLPRTLEASTDISASLRQGLVALAGHPRIWGKAFPGQFPTFASKAAYDLRSQDIRDNPEYENAVEHGLNLTELKDDPSKREEQFYSDLAERIPVVKHLVRGSGRSYTYFLNQLRMDIFKSVKDHQAQHGYRDSFGRHHSVNVEDPTYLKSLAKYVNAATGRGGLGRKLEPHAAALTAIFFSPRLMAARLNMVNPLWYRSLHPAVRGQAIKSMATLLTATAAGLYAGHRALNAAVGTDPRSADFAKLRFGNTRIDPLGGFQQYARFGAQMGPGFLGGGKIISSTTGKTMTLGPGVGKLSRFDIADRFFEGKSNPVVGAALEQLHGRTYTGNDINYADPRYYLSTAYNKLTPLSVQDAVGQYQQAGGNAPLAAASFAGAALGLGVQAYGPKPVLQRELTKAKKIADKQNLHLDHLVARHILSPKQRGAYREALDVYDLRNAQNKAIDSQVDAQHPVTRETKKILGLIDLLHKHKIKPPGGWTWPEYRHHYLTAKLSQKSLRNDREWLWRQSGYSDMLTYYRDKSGAND